MQPVEIVPVQDNLVLRARGSELLILTQHVRKLKELAATKDFAHYFVNEALVNRPARKLFEAWLRKDGSLWPRLYKFVHREMELGADTGDSGVPAPAVKADKAEAKPVAEKKPVAPAEKPATKTEKPVTKAAAETAKATTDKSKPAAKAKEADKPAAKAAEKKAAPATKAKEADKPAAKEAKKKDDKGGKDKAEKKPAKADKSEKKPAKAAKDKDTKKTAEKAKKK